MAATATPPLPPDVTAQQQGTTPLQQYADMQDQNAGGAPNPPSGIDMIEGLMNEVADKLSQIAKVAQMVNPQLVEYIKKMAQVGGAAMQDIQASKQKQVQGGQRKTGLEPSRGGQEGPSGVVTQ
jgi:hypothetical protein